MIPYILFLTILVVIYFSYVAYNKKRMASIERINNFMMSDFPIKNYGVNTEEISAMTKVSVEMYVDEFVSLRRKINNFEGGKESVDKVVNVDAYSSRIDVIKNECKNKLNKLPKKLHKRFLTPFPNRKWINWLTLCLSHFHH